MRQRFSPRTYYLGARTPEAVIAAMENFISWEAFRLAWSAPDQADSLLYEDLEQEARLYVHRLLERDPGIWIQKLERLTHLWMRNILRRGRSVFRADHGKRQRSYLRVALKEARSEDSCTKNLPLGQERQLLTRALEQACSDGNRAAEHQALLLLRRLARSTENEPLLQECNTQLRAWWRQERQGGSTAYA